MLRDLSESLQALLTQPGLPPELGSAVVSFDRPSDPFTPAQTTVNLFLFEIRENRELRNNEPVIRRQGNQAIVEPPPMRVSCRYLITAWPVGNLDLALQEHRLLSQVLQLLARFPVIPAGFLQGSLIGQDPPLPVLVAQPTDIDHAAEFWASVGNRLRPSIVLEVVISMPISTPVTLPVVISGSTAVENIGSGVPAIELFRIGGTIRDAGANPVTGAEVTLLQRGRVTSTNVRGEFTLSAIPAGNYTLRAASNGNTQDKAITVPAAQGDDYDIQLP
jgi:uncharacterized protein DUF4255/carboxypeptidase family protein